jgi:hypothetical protein
MKIAIEGISQSSVVDVRHACAHIVEPTIVGAVCIKCGERFEAELEGGTYEDIA